MKPKPARVGMWRWMCLVAAVLVAPASGWGQAPSLEGGAAESASTGRSVVAGVGAVAGSIVYAPFKAVIMCPVSALAAGVTYVAARGEGETPSSLLRLGCTGTYVITPAMVQGREAFRASGER